MACFLTSQFHCFRPFIGSPPTPLSSKCLPRNNILSNTNHCPQIRRAHTRPMNLITMTADNSHEDQQDMASDKTTPADDPDEGVSVWGVTSFAIIFLIFAFAIAATLARDFIPGGVTTPVS